MHFGGIMAMFFEIRHSQFLIHVACAHKQPGGEFVCLGLTPGGTIVLLITAEVVAVSAVEQGMSEFVADDDLACCSIQILVDDDEFAPEDNGIESPDACGQFQAVDFDAQFAGDMVRIGRIKMFDQVGHAQFDVQESRSNRMNIYGEVVKIEAVKS